MFVKLFGLEGFVSLSKRFFSCFCSIVKLQLSEKARFFQLEPQPKFFSIACAMHNSVVEILLASTGKLLKFYRFESVQNLVSF